MDLFVLLLWSPEQGPVMGVKFSPTGEFFASVGLDEQVYSMYSLPAMIHSSIWPIGIGVED